MNSPHGAKTVTGGAPVAGPGALGDRRVQAAQSLHQDLVTIEVSRLLAEAGLPSVLLKGPSIGRWLYRDGVLRPYVDTDLLVPRCRFRAAARVLRRAGFRPEAPMLAWRHEHAVPFRRARDRAQVDLHHMLGLMDCSVDPWPVLVHRTEELLLAGHRLRVLDEPARCVHVALHAAQGRTAKAREDLRRAVDQVPEPVWERAAALARRLRCEGEVAAGLAVDPVGAELARRLGMRGRASSKVRALRSAGAERTYGRLVSQRTWSGRAALVVGSAVPGRLLLRGRYRWARGPLVALALVVDDTRKVVRLGRALAGRRAGTALASRGARTVDVPPWI